MKHVANDVFLTWRASWHIYDWLISTFERPTEFVGFGLAAWIPPKLEQVPIAKIAAALAEAFTA